MKRATLTFDNGPDPEVTPRVLDVLREHGVRAHFYVLGRALATREGALLVKRALAEGHHVGNHSYTHAVPLGEDTRAEAVDLEIVATAALLAELAPHEVKRFRPFGGGGALGRHLLSPRAVEHLVANGYTCVLWNSVPRDWVEPEAWSARALDDCDALPHAVIVLHDIPKACLAALPKFLDDARARGVELVLDLPEGCTPIVEGRVLADLRPFTA